MQLHGRVEKAWGYEDIWVSNDKYCCKFLNFTQIGAKFSMHFHKEKHETWRVMSGEFKVVTIDTTDATQTAFHLREGDVFDLEPMRPHQLTCIAEGAIIEVSTPDSVEDNYRVLPGDSQTKGTT